MATRGLADWTCVVYVHRAHGDDAGWKTAARSQFFQEVLLVPDGQTEVREQHVELILAQAVERRANIGDGLNPMAELCQKPIEGVPNIRAGVNNQDA